MSVTDHLTMRVSNNIRASLILYIRLYNELALMFGDAERNIGLAEAGMTLANFSWFHFRWAISIVISRQNIVPIAASSAAAAGTYVVTDAGPKPKSTELALIPVWDLMNHSIESVHGDDDKVLTENGSASASASETEKKSSDRPNANGGTHIPELQTFFNAETNSVEFKSPTNVPKGAEICMFYGERSNFELLLYSGFCLASNRFDVVDICVPLMAHLNNQMPPGARFEFVAPGDPKFHKIREMVFKTYVAGAGRAGVKYGVSELPFPLSWDTPAPAVGVEAVPFQFLLSCFLYACESKDELSSLLRSPPASASELFVCAAPAAVKDTLLCAVTAVKMLLAYEYGEQRYSTVERASDVEVDPSGSSAATADGALGMMQVMRLAHIQVGAFHLKQLLTLLETL